MEQHRSSGPESPGGVSRRAVLRGGGLVTVALLAPVGPAGRAVAVPVTDGAPVHLDEQQFRTLTAVVDRIVPADLDVGGADAGCAAAIDALLGAFREETPRIYAGAPFSDRAGSDVNHFEDFLALDAYESRAWRLRIEGSQGQGALEFNGPVKGYQRTYADGLEALDRAAAPRRFADLTPVEQDLLLRTSDDPLVAELMDVAVPHTLQFMYGAPEYGGNEDLAAWTYTRYAGDVQPRGWTREEIEERDDDGPVAAPLPDVVDEDRLVTALAVAVPEVLMGMTAQGDGTLSSLRDQVRSTVDGTLEGVRNGW